MNGDHLGYNLYAYLSNNPINNIDPTGQFLKKITSKIKSATKKVANTVKEVTNTIVSKTKSVVSSIKKAFVFESEVGFGLGAGLGICPAKVKIGASKTFGYGYNKGSSYQYTSTTIGFDAKLNNYGVGLGFDLRNYDNGIGNPMAMPWEVWNKPNTSREINIFWKNTKFTGAEVSSSEEHLLE